MNNLHIQYILYILCLIYVVRNVWGMVPRTTCIYILHCDCLFYVLKIDNQWPVYFITQTALWENKTPSHYSIFFVSHEQLNRGGSNMESRYMRDDKIMTDVTRTQLPRCRVPWYNMDPRLQTQILLHIVAVVTVKQVTLLVFQTQWAVPGLRMWAVSSEVIRVI